jgi:hypothetical protein
VRTKNSFYGGSLPYRPIRACQNRYVRIIEDHRADGPMQADADLLGHPAADHSIACNTWTDGFYRASAGDRFIQALLANP